MVLLMPNSMSLTLPNVIQIACQAYQRPTERIPKLVHSVNPNGQGSDVSMLSAKLIFFGNVVGLEGRVLNNRRSSCGMLIVRAATTKEKRKKHYPGESKGFVEEMRFVAMRLHTKDTAKEGEKEPDAQPVGAWEPSIEGYLKFLVDSKLVYDTLETIVEKAPRPAYAEFRNTGLERSEKLAKDLEWFEQQGHAIPEPNSPGTTYAKYVEELGEKDPPAFICHFYNIYFAHTAGGRIIGKKVAEKILDGRELEFYKWDRDLSELLKHVKEKLNKVAESWSRQEKNSCLEETAKSFKFSGKILRLILS